jgi:GxxExxY protein
MGEYLHRELTERIIHSYYQVYNALGYGFLERVYERAMLVELKREGLCCRSQQSIIVRYRGEHVGEYSADIVVEDSVILELKATASLLEEHEKQLINYLRATEIEVGLLLNFGKKPEVRRKVFSNRTKK